MLRQSLQHPEHRAQAQQRQLSLHLFGDRKTAP
jgi:hypothetical protein